MIELLVCLFILAFSVLSLIRLQWLSLQNSKDSLFQSIAMIMETDALNRLNLYSNHLSQSPGNLISFKEKTDDSIRCTVSACSPDDIIKYDLKLWQEDVAKNLPNGQGQIIVLADHPPSYLVSIRFKNHENQWIYTQLNANL